MDRALFPGRNLRPIQRCPNWRWRRIWRGIHLLSTGSKFKRWFLDCSKSKSWHCHSISSSALSTSASSTISSTTASTTTTRTGFEFLVLFHFYHQFQSQIVNPYAIIGIPSTVPHGQSVITDHFQPIRPALPHPIVSEAPTAKTQTPKPEPSSPSNFFPSLSII